MRQITIRLREDTIEELEAEAEDAGVSRSEHVRDVIASRADVERLRDRIETLEEQLARRSQVEDRVEELALELREDRAQVDAPWPVRWLDWWRSR